MPFVFSASSKRVSDPQLTHTELLDEISRGDPAVLTMFVRAYLQERTPAAFAARPMLWEAIREWVAGRLNVHAREVGLSGSAQSGFSVKQSKAGAPFDPQSSDLDLFVVNPRYFARIEGEARKFLTRSNTGASYQDQVKTVGRQLGLGFIDLNQIPANHEHYPTLASARNDASILTDRLRLHGFSLKPSHFRIYKDWGALGMWVRRSYSVIRG